MKNFIFSLFCLALIGCASPQQQEQNNETMNKENNELTAFDMQLEVSTLHHHAVRQPESVAIYEQQQRS